MYNVYPNLVLELESLLKYTIFLLSFPIFFQKKNSLVVGYCLKK